MYFESRTQAGQMLAGVLLEKYRYDNCAVLATSDSSVLVAEPIAIQLHSTLSSLIIEEIEVPGQGLSFGGISQSGNFTYNSSLSSGEVDGYVNEFHGYLEEQKREKMQRINRMLGDGGEVDRNLLQDRTVIIVADGIDNGTLLDAALDFLKPVRINKLVVATPLASVPAVDRIHVLADDMEILDVRDNFMGINHYYDNNEIPTHEEITQRINQIILNWV
jgi:putative phosphoribosyl transferase